MLLQVKDLHTYYGNIKALRGVSFYVDEGEILSFIGANGAGKSTLMNTLSGATTWSIPTGRTLRG